jgi:heme/copper-type cytochrome/quinol oxidase subunit 3
VALIAKVAHESPRADALRPPRLPRFDTLPAASGLERPAPHAAVALREDTARLSACLFVLVDGIFFASLLGLVVLVRAARPEVFSYGRYFLEPLTGLVGTCVLFGGSLTTTMATHAALRGRRRRFVAALGMTCVLAGTFLALQVSEYADHADRGLLPGRHFLPTEEVWETAPFRGEHESAARYAAHFRSRGETARPQSTAEIAPLLRAGALGATAVYPAFPSQPRNAHLFFGLYFVVGAVHALHVLALVLVFGWLAFRARRGDALDAASESADRAALFFHLAVLMRVALFPLFFLVR